MCLLKTLEDGTSVTYDDITWERKNRSKLLKLSFVTALASVHLLKLSRNWYFASFVPYFLLNYMDKKYVPYAQIESFYKYVYERRKADHNYLSNQQRINEAISKDVSSETLSALTEELKLSNLTVYEAANGIYNSYLDQA